MIALDPPVLVRAIDEGKQSLAQCELAKRFVAVVPQV